MKVIEPVEGNISFGSIVIIDKRIYQLPRDLDWLVCRTSQSESKFSWIMWIVVVVACILFPPFMILFALSYLFWRWNGGDRVATVELRMKDGTFIRGITANSKEIAFAEQNQFGELPPKTQRQHFPKAPILKMVKADHNAP